MSDEEIIEALKSGDVLTYGCNGRNFEVMQLMADLESRGLIETWDESLSQETRRGARWIAEGTRDE